jgi:hypothetical protein
VKESIERCLELSRVLGESARTQSGLQIGIAMERSIKWANDDRLNWQLKACNKPWRRHLVIPHAQSKKQVCARRRQRQLRCNDVLMRPRCASNEHYRRWPSQTASCTQYTGRWLKRHA